MFLLAPFAWLYGCITSIRNFIYNNRYKNIYTPAIPTIIIGNLSTGGTGKTPHTAYFLNIFGLKYNVAVLSRGYRRATKGYIQANPQCTATEIGDEPMEYLSKYAKVTVCVGENRVNAAKRIEEINPKIDILFLDDALQHRAIDGHIKILLTTYEKPYFNDYLLPMGNLRESRKGAQRANFIIVTKCPVDLTPQQQNRIINKINPKNGQNILFSTYQYLPIEDLITRNILTISKKIVLVSGIASSDDLIQYIQKNYGPVLHEKRRDHHIYTQTQIIELINKYPKEKYQIILTRKDAVKWYPYVSLISVNHIGVIDIEVKFLNSPTNMIAAINELVNENK